jgi:hypothetical protein
MLCLKGGGEEGVFIVMLCKDYTAPKHVQYSKSTMERRTSCDSRLAFLQRKGTVKRKFCTYFILAIIYKLLSFIQSAIDIFHQPSNFSYNTFGNILTIEIIPFNNNFI